MKHFKLSKAGIVAMSPIILLTIVSILAIIPAVVLRFIITMIIFVAIVHYAKSHNIK